MNDTILITGSSGFIGSHLAEYYLIRGLKVIGLDNYITGDPNNTGYLSKKYPAQFHFIQHDVCLEWPAQLKELISSLATKKLKYVFHLASPASVKNFQKFSIETLHANSIGLEKALKFADAFKARLIFSSTSEIYGSPLSSPQKESDWGNTNPFGERSCYDESKRFGEALIYSWNKKTSQTHVSHALPSENLPIQHGIVRIFNTYGPRMHEDDDRVPHNFIKKALAGQDLHVFGDGQQTRSFCYIDDLVQGLSAYADSNLNFPVNFGNDTETRVLDLAQIVIRLTKSQSKIVLKELPKDDPPQRRPDLSVAKKLLNYAPHVNLDLGLLKTIDWHKTK